MINGEKQKLIGMRTASVVNHSGDQASQGYPDTRARREVEPKNRRSPTRVSENKEREKSREVGTLLREGTSMKSYVYSLASVNLAQTKR